MDRHEFEAIARYSKKAERLEQQAWTRVELIGGSRIYVPDEDQSVAPHVVNDGYWESWISAWLLNQLMEGEYDNFLDVGANSGYFSVIADPYVKRIVMFEPNNAMISALDMTAFGLKAKTTVVANAVWDKAGETLTLRMPGTLIGSSSVIDKIDFTDYAVRSQVVSTVTVDSIVESLKIKGKTMIKIDVESAEERVWNGMLKTLEDIKPVVFMEYTPGMYSDDFLPLIREYGTIRKIGFDGYEYLVSDEEIVNSPDWAMLVIRPKD